MRFLQSRYGVWVVPTSFSLLLSALISLPLMSPQEEEGIRPNCVQVGPFEELTQAVLLNRIGQLKSAIELSRTQAMKLSVAAKGVLKRQADFDEGWFYFGNPMRAELWQKTVKQTLSEEQLSQLEAFDAEVKLASQKARSRYDADEADTDAQADFVSSNLQRFLYLTNSQTQKVRDLLRSHLDGIDREDWDPSLQTFYQSNESDLNQMLTESQRVFFDGQTLKNGIGDSAVWSFEWRRSKCTDCHVAF